MNFFNRSNFLGTEFLIYDTGLNPKETSDFPRMRLQLGVILYVCNFILKIDNISN